MVTWTELFPDLDEPVGGQPAEYVSAAANAAQVGESMAACSAGFATVAEGESTQLAGATGTAMAGLLAGIDRSLHALPDVFGSLAALLHDHAMRLDALRSEATAALGRAALRATAVDLTERTVAQETAALAAIDTQLRAARIAAWAGDAEATARVELFEARRWSAQHRVVTAEQAHADARDQLAVSRGEHDQLADAERSLRGQTWAVLRFMDLGDLADPSGFVHAVTSAADWAWDHTGGALIEMTDSLAEAAVAFADGRFFDSLHHLSDAIDAATDLLTGITVIVVVAGVTVCPGALAALPALVAAGQALGQTDLALTGALAVSQTAHPETGATVGIADVFAAGVEYAASAALAGTGSAVASTGHTQAAALARAGAGPSARQTFVRTAVENRTVVDAAASGAARIVNPATGARVAGAARDALVERATVELAADSTLRQLATVVDTAIANELAGDVAEPYVDTFTSVLTAIHPRAEPAIDRYVLGALATQTRALAETWRHGLGSAGLHRRVAPYVVVAA